MPGVMCTIDAIGYKAKAHESDDRNDATKADQKPEELLADLMRVTNPNGHIGLIGVYFSEDPGGAALLTRHT
jgi:glutathione-independent formaldehyde dehydrogenase